jgi:glycosyltransferase involved in cell wall biosynthesis
MIGHSIDSLGHKIVDTRISNVTHVSNWNNVKIGNNVFIGHFNYIDGFDRVTIGNGCQITNYVSVLTHSSHNSIRLYGEHYIEYWKNKSLKAALSGPVTIGEYSFIGPHSVIMPGTTLGKGCVVSAFSFVRGEFDDYSIIKGNPAVVIGDSRNIDEDFINQNPELQHLHFLTSERDFKKRKIILFTLYYPYTHEGVSYDLYVKNEVDELAKNFESIEIISLSKGHDGQLEVPANVKVHNLSALPTFWDKCKLATICWKDYFRYELRNLKVLYGRTLNYDLLKSISIYAVKAEKQAKFLEKILKQIDYEKTDVWVYSYWNFEEALASVLLQKKYPIKTVIRSHSLDLYFDRVPEKYLPFRRFAFFKSSLFTFISEQGMDYFFRIHKITPNLFSKAFVSRIGIKNNCPQYEHNHKKLVILSNAWIRPLKRIDLLIESLALINDFEVEWIHVGDGYGTTYFEPVRELATRLLDGKRNIKYEFIGRKNLDELFKIFADRNINLLINLSSTEGTPVSMMEALSFGVPIIATKVGGVPEIVEDGKNGFLLNPDISAQQVADKISMYYRLPEEQKKTLSKNAREMWEKRFNSDSNSQVLLKRLLSI